MTLDFGTVGYLVAAMGYAVLLVVLLVGWQKRGGHGALLIVAALFSLIWTGVVAWQGANNILAPKAVLAFEMLRDAAWVAFLWRILRHGGADTRTVPRAINIIAVTAGVMLVASLAALLLPATLLVQFESIRFVLLSKLVLAISVLVLTEQLYRCTTPERRWAIKHLCIALVGIFSFDFYKYAEALLFQDVNFVLLDARGYLNAVVAPLVAVSASRNPRWKLEVFVSRQVVFHGGVLAIAGIYLMAVAAAGYYLRQFGGDWGGISQVVLVFTAIVLMFVVVASRDVRSRFKVFINKHFFHYRFDHREEWLRITQTLIGEGLAEEALPHRSIRAIADIVESPGGMLWMKHGDKRYAPEARWRVDDSPRLSEEEEDELVCFLERTGWIIESQEYRERPEHYEGLRLPKPLLDSEWIWIIVPLLQKQELVGVVFLAHPRIKQEMNWEVRDLIKVAAHHVAGYLQLGETLRALAEARQFEGFNRLSAYVIHDLKNLIAQLSLVVSNAQRHRGNPEFLQDVVATVENSVTRMTKLLEQLRAGDTPRQPELIDLVEIAQQAVAACAIRTPQPRLEVNDEGLAIDADRERLLSVARHLIQNAQEATPADGRVVVRVGREGNNGYLDIEDTGCGMDAAFVRERLFRPFDSTKGLTGMGIGAFEGREMFRAMGGGIEVESEPGKGTHLHCQVPLSGS